MASAGDRAADIAFAVLLAGVIISDGPREGGGLIKQPSLL
jgi:hypothetical protein